MAGPPFKWQWVENVDVSERDGKTHVEIRWRSKPYEEPEPTSPVGEVNKSCGDCIVWLGAGLVNDGAPMPPPFTKTTNLGTPDVTDAGTVELVLPGTGDGVVVHRGDVYDEDHWREAYLNQKFGLESFPNEGTPVLESVRMPDVAPGSEGEYSVTLDTEGGVEAAAQIKVEPVVPADHRAVISGSTHDDAAQIRVEPTVSAGGDGVVVEARKESGLTPLTVSGSYRLPEGQESVSARIVGTLSSTDERILTRMSASARRE